MAVFILAQLAESPPNWRLSQSRKSKFWNIQSLAWKPVWKIEVENFPAFIVMDDKGNDFFDLG
jgi:tartrate dehydratase beta subunit/fumarate hydratase class I family protein